METAHIEIHPLSEERTNDYIEFFEISMSPDTGEWGHRCYCVAYCGTDNCNTDGFEMADARRDGAIQYIKDGVLCGYLAYADGRPVAWCNANDRAASLDCFGMKYFIGADTLPDSGDMRIKSVFCFEVIPEMRGKHIATALLERVIADAAADGYDFVEAYPEKTDADPEHSYAGHKAFYEKMGFALCGETEHRFVMRRKL